MTAASGEHVTAGQLLILPDGRGPFTHIIRDPVGIHARPAGEMVSLLRNFSCRVTVRCGNRTADGNSILEWMRLGAGKGAELHVSAEGADAGIALMKLKQYMDEKL